jgi:DNA-binding response OmpR family regulator
MTKTILIVEDQTISAHMLFNICEKDYRIIFARSIADAKELLSKNEVDLILLDNQLPDGLGLDFCKELKTYHYVRHIPIIIVTADDIELEALQAGAIDYLKKPPNRAIALERIKKHI